MTPLMQKVAQVAPVKYGFIMKTASEVRQSPFRDEIVENLNTLIKKANQSFMSRVGGAIGPAAAGIGATVATGIAYNLAGDMFDSVKRGITKSRGYKAMLRENPDLAEHPAKSVQKVYSTLHRFNPDFAMDPTVAGSFVRRQVALGEFDTKMLTEAISARKNLEGVTNLPLPGRLPWESSDEKKHRGLMSQQLEQQIAQGKEEHGRRGKAHEMQIEEHGRRGQSHAAQMEEHGRSGQSHAHQMQMNPLEMARTMQQLQAHPLQMQQLQANLNRAGAMGPMEMEKSYLDLLKARRGKQLDDAEDIGEVVAGRASKK